MNSSPSFVLKAVALLALSAVLVACERTKEDANDVDKLVSAALESIRRADMKAAETLVARANELEPQATDVRFLVAEMAWYDRNFSRAKEVYTALANETKLASKLRAQALAGRGMVEMSSNDHDLARVSFLTALRLDRGCASAWYHLGHLYRFSPFNYAEASLDCYSTFVDLQDEATPRVQKTQKSIIPALKETIASTKAERPGVANRNSAQCLAAIARAEEARKKGAFKTARAAFEEALKADPLSYAAALGLAETTLKAEPTAKGEKKALEAYRTACSLRPSVSSTFMTCGRLAERLSMPAQAREAYSRALAAKPASREALQGLIRALRKSGAKEKVIRAYEGYLAILPAKRP